MQLTKAYVAETSCISCYWFCYVSAHDQFARYRQRTNEPLRHHLLQSTFLVARWLSVNISCRMKTFQQVPWTFRAASWHSRNFRAARRLSIIFRQVSKRPEDLPATFVKFTYGQKIFRQILSTFRSAVRPTVNFCQLSMRPLFLASTFGTAGRVSVAFHHLPCHKNTFR